MTVSKINAFFNCDVEEVWKIVASVGSFGWRSDLSKVDVKDEKHFTEYAKNGYPTFFTITAEFPTQRLEFDIENGNMQGRWVGLFTPKDGGTEVEFTEVISVKKAIMKPFVKAYLKRQQRRYISDLEKELSRIS